MSTCKECIYYEVCDRFTAPNETYPEVGGCKVFKPQADYVEVKHGKWISELVERCDWRGRKQKYYQPNSCSLCHKAVLERTNFCPDCGAKMKGGAE